MESFHLIYNPSANRGGSKKYLEAFVDILKKENKIYEIYETAHAGHATQITREIIAGGGKFIVAIGGDGTVHEVVNGFTPGDEDAGVVFGVLPAGTGNDVATMLGAPAGLENVRAAAKNIIEENIKRVDYIASSRGQQSVLFFSYGIAATMVLKMEKFKNKNKFSYYKSLILHMFTFKAQTYEYFVNGEGPPKHIKADFLGLHNCIHAGGGMQLVHNAALNDGLLELLIVENRGLPRRICNLIAIATKKLHKQPNVQIIKSTKLKINSPDDNLCCVDGEVHHLSHLDLHIVPKGMNFFWD